MTPSGEIMKTGASRLLRRSIVLAATGILALVLTACTGRGGGQLPPQSPAFTGSASFGFTFSCEDKGGVNPPTGQLHVELAYIDHGTSLIGSPFGIHGIVDTIDPPELESLVCIGQSPPPGGNELIFLGRYRLTTSPPPTGFPKSCTGRETKTKPLCRFEVIVRDNDGNVKPSEGDFFSIKLSTITSTTTTDCPPGGIPPCVITEFPPGAPVFYARAGTLKSGNLTVD
jgi:hypothetical protein